MKLCVDCDNYTFDRFGKRVCDRFPAKLNPVTGELANTSVNPYTERVLGWLGTRLTGACGAEARFFKPKESTS